MTLEIVKSGHSKIIKSSVPVQIVIENYENRPSILSSDGRCTQLFVFEKNIRPARAADNFLKSFLDRIIATIGLLFFLPLFIFIALAIKAETNASPFFRQYRTGLMGKPFKIWKFRTMFVAENGGAITQAIRNDMRVTRVGRFLRRTSLDELPQLINVMLGEMSLIGPRPHALAHDEYYANKITDYKKRFAVRPGISGLAQVSGSRGPTESLEKMAKRIELDCQYIDNWKVFLDIKILLKTFISLTSHDAF